MSAVLPPLPLGEGGLRAAEPSATYIVEREVALIHGFELLATAQGGVDTLRKLVLSLAVQGRLVRPEPAAESVSLLLDRIREARKTSNPRRSAFVAVPTAEQCRFALPSDWCWVRLDQVANMRLGKMLDKAKNTGTFRPYLRNTNVQWHRFELNDIKDIRLEAHELEEYRLVTGDLLVCEGGEPGRCAIWRGHDREMYFQKALHRIRPLGGVLPEFIQLCLTHDAATGVLASYFTGATIKHFAGQELSRYAIPLPPIAEQHRIVARVEELMKLCDALEQSGRLADEQNAGLRSTLFDALAASESAHALAENWQRIAEHFDLLLDRPEAIDALEQTILQLAVRGLLVPQERTDESGAKLLSRIQRSRAARRKLATRNDEAGATPDDSLPGSWSWASIDQISADDVRAITDGPFGANLKTEHYIDRPGFRVVRLQNIGHGEFRDEHRAYIDEALLNALEKHQTYAGDLVVAGLIDNSIRCCAVPSDIGPAIVKADCYRLAVHPLVSTGYVLHYLNSGMAHAFAAVHHHGLTLTRIGLGNFRSVPIPLPPLAEQHRIVARVEKLRRLCAQLRERLTAVRHTQALLADALVAQTSS